MRIALISDIHGNLSALEACADDIRAADSVVCLGDLAGYFCQVNEVIDFVRTLDLLCLRGNHDQFLLRGCPPDANDAVRFGIEYARKVIKPTHLQWLSGLPALWAGELGNRSVLFCHGSPWSPIDGYLYKDSPALGKLRDFDVDLLAFGQTHRPYLDDSGRPLLVNPGSVGQARHAPARACMAIFNTIDGTCELIERSYDPTSTLEFAREQGAGAWITKHFAESLEQNTGAQRERA